MRGMIGGPTGRLAIEMDLKDKPFEDTECHPYKVELAVSQPPKSLFYF